MTNGLYYDSLYFDENKDGVVIYNNKCYALKRFGYDIIEIWDEDCETHILNINYNNDFEMNKNNIDNVVKAYYHGIEVGKFIGKKNLQYQLKNLILGE